MKRTPFFAIALTLLALAGFSTTASAQFQEGVHYFPIGQAAAPSPDGTIEVEEMVDDPVVAYSDNDVTDADLRLKSARNGSVSQDDVFVKTCDEERRSLTRSAENINKMR